MKNPIREVQKYGQSLGITSKPASLFEQQSARARAKETTCS
jgi:hypothetical protein